MSKKTKRRTVKEVGATVTPVTPSPPPSELANQVNRIIQASIAIALEASTNNCNCKVCQMARQIAPIVKDLIIQGLTSGFPQAQSKAEEATS